MSERLALGPADLRITSAHNSPNEGMLPEAAARNVRAKAAHTGIPTSNSTGVGAAQYVTRFWHPRVSVFKIVVRIGRSTLAGNAQFIALLGKRLPHIQDVRCSFRLTRRRHCGRAAAQSPISSPAPSLVSVQACVGPGVGLDKAARAEGIAGLLVRHGGYHQLEDPRMHPPLNENALGSRNQFRSSTTALDKAAGSPGQVCCLIRQPLAPAALPCVEPASALLMTAGLEPPAAWVF